MRGAGQHSVFRSTNRGYMNLSLLSNNLGGWQGLVRLDKNQTIFNEKEAFRCLLVYISSYVRCPPPVSCER
jgi:hypothetical protein